MVLFQRIDTSQAGVPHQDAHRLIALAEGRRLRSRVLPGPALRTAPRQAPLVALHGISRDARALWQGFGRLAAAEGRTLLVPRFTEEEWPRFQQIGPSRPDLALLDLFRQAGLGGQRVDLFGFSGGAQLAHRFAMLYPDRVATLHLAAPGWYTLPDAAVAWPQGLGTHPGCRPRAFDAAALSRLHLRRYLSLRVRLWVGALDTGREPSLRQTAEVDAIQGTTRLERARRYAERFESAARAMGIAPDIRLTVLPGCGHDFTECARIGGLAAQVLHGG
jgi:pimeloyl-ACP methyl ester carboxylesterase